MTSAPAIGFEYRPSRWLCRLLLLVSLLAVLATWISAVPWLAKLIVTASVPFACWRAWTRFSDRWIQAAGCARDGSWNLQMHSGEDAAATLASFRVIGEKIVWLRLSSPGQRQALLLLAPDNSDADIRRRLRMRLAQIEASGTLAAERGPTV
nr:protein YgfX [Dyella sp. ASV24]